VAAIEAILLVTLVLSLGPALSAWKTPAAIVLIAFVVAFGIVGPIVARFSKFVGIRLEAWGEIAVLAAGFALRTLIVIPVEKL
jgi:hypothetical protein